MPDAVFEIIIGMGMIAQMWRLTAKVSALTAIMAIRNDQGADHEARLRKLESVRV